ncbi:tricarboxylate transporter [Terasakiispira papahanaumokuakeensis]|nr:tricarboxylate transporter [Terasakiispira papahanaumokuakeensis]
MSNTLGLSKHRNLKHRNVKCTSFKRMSLKHSLKTVLACLLPVMGVLPLSSVAHANVEVPDTLTWTVPFGVGGGTDVWARFMSNWVTQDLPGQPTVVIDNVPGGGSITGVNLFSKRADADGDEMIVTSASTQYPAMLRDRRVRYHYADWELILAAPTGGVVYASSSLGQDSDSVLKKLASEEVKFAGQTPTGLEMPVLMAFDMLGFKISPVFGMKSRGEGRLAFERGEVALDFQTTSAYKSNVTPLIEAGQAVPLFSLGMMNEDGHIERDPSFPDLPTFSELYLAQSGHSRNDEAYQIFHKFFASGYAMQKMLLVPKDVDPQLLEQYRQAARTLADDPAFLKEAEQKIGPYKLMVGQKAAAHLQSAMQLSETQHEWVKQWLMERHHIRLQSR